MLLGYQDLTLYCPVIKCHYVYSYTFFPNEMKDNSELAPVSNGALKCTCYEDYHCEAAL